MFQCCTLYTAPYSKLQLVQDIIPTWYSRGCDIKILDFEKIPGGKKQLYFGFLLNRLDPPPLVSLDMFEEFFFWSHYKLAKVPLKVWIRVRPPPFLEKCPNLS